MGPLILYHWLVGILLARLRVRPVASVLSFSEVPEMKNIVITRFTHFKVLYNVFSDIHMNRNQSLKMRVDSASLLLASLTLGRTF